MIQYPKPLIEHNEQVLNNQLLSELVVNIITLEQYRREQAYDLAFNEGIEISTMDDYADMLMLSSFGAPERTEFVEVHDGYILVVINTEIIDNNAMLHAYNLLLSEIGEEQQDVSSNIRQSRQWKNNNP